MSEEPKNEEPKNEEPKNQVTISIGSEDGFEDIDAADRLIQGSILKCVDGHWSAKDGTPISADTPCVVLGTTTALQHWKDQQPIETIVKQFRMPLPDLEELNAKIPKKEWEKGLDGNPRPPWVKQFVVYLLNPAGASIYTFINSTVGAAIAVDRLKDRARWMRAIRSGRVHPIVKLSSRPMKTRHGQEMRPEFEVIEWRDIGALQAAPQPALEHIGKPVAEPSLEEKLDDQMPF